MQQLNALDANFLYVENGNNYSHISGLAVYDPSTAPGGKVRFKDILKTMDERTRQVPALRSVLKRVPFELDFPYWVISEDFDPEFHVRHIALPHPGDWRQLCIQTARLHSRPLDRGKPMWEMYIIEGLDNIKGLPKGCFGVFIKVHHAAIDGASTVDLASATHDFEAKPKRKPPLQPNLEADKIPSDVELIIRGQINNTRTPSRIFDLFKNNFPNWMQSYSKLKSGELERITDVPRTRFNGTVSANRAFEAECFTLDDIRSIKNLVNGATVNDVAVTLCGGALRKYLQSKKELPEESLVALAPINIRTKDQEGKGGNQVSQMNVRLHTDIANPLKRLQAVQSGNSKAKELNKAVGARTMIDTSQIISSSLMSAAMKLTYRTGLNSSASPKQNTVVTNVPGLQVPIYFCGAKMIRSYGLGTSMDGMGLFHSVTSYCGLLAFSVTSCRDMMPDPEFYAKCLRDSFKELKALAK